jgi:hydrogenase small subunit
MGCKGPQATFNCPSVRFNDGTSWPVKSGHGCVGCGGYKFWETKSPFYERLPNVPGFGVDVGAGQIGIGITAAVAGATIVHGIASAVRDRLRTLPGASDKS